MGTTNPQRVPPFKGMTRHNWLEALDDYLTEAHENEDPAVLNREESVTDMLTDFLKWVNNGGLEYMEFTTWDTN